MTKTKELIDSAIDEINKNSKIRMKRASDLENIGFISSGVHVVDYLFGCGGIPTGRIIELAGKKSSSKTALAQTIVASVQRAGKLAAWVDAEHAFEPNYAKTLGVDTSTLLFHEPESGNTALNLLKSLVKMPDLGVIVVDSAAALVPQDELDESKQLGRQAAMMSLEIRKIVALSNRLSPAIIFINQLRDNIGVMWGEKEKSPGGRALGFYASVQLYASQIQKIKSEKDQIVGIVVKLVAKKNKVGMPYREVEYTLSFKAGIPATSGLFTLCKKLGVIKNPSAQKYLYNGVEFKKDDFKTLFAEHKDEILMALEKAE